MQLVRNSPVAIGALDAIYARFAVRSYLDQAVSYENLHALLKAAVRAPTAMHAEPWAFVVVEKKDILKRLSDHAKIMMKDEENKLHPKSDNKISDHTPPENLFYNAPALIIIYGKGKGEFVAADCWLAAENLMLSAYAMGLGTCVIGSSVSALNTSEWKKEFGVGDDMAAIAPIIVGLPSKQQEPTSRKEPRILLWS